MGCVKQGKQFIKQIRKVLSTFVQNVFYERFLLRAQFRLDGTGWSKGSVRVKDLYSFISDQTGKMFKRAVVSSFCIIWETAGWKFTGS
jgi:hypothetical protein